MEIIKANSAGFCFGVSTAVDKLQQEVNNSRSDGQGPIYTWGPIIHNSHVINDFEKQGVTVLNTVDELMAIEHGTVLIRSHGTTRTIVELLEKKNIRVVDGTCPFVKKIHKIVEEQGREGREIIIIGKGSHPEVEGIMGWCITPVHVLETVEDVESFSVSTGTKLCTVCQTTFNVNKFQKFVEILACKGYDNYVLNTICNATEKRQQEAFELAARVDAMVVVGDLRSSNTNKLFEICKAKCNNTYLVETVTDIDSTWFTDSKCIGITAGASTPNNIIEEVQNSVRFNF